MLLAVGALGESPPPPPVRISSGHRRQSRDPFAYTAVRPSSASFATKELSEPLFGPFFPGSAAAERYPTNDEPDKNDGGGGGGGDDDEGLHLFTQFLLRDLSANKTESSGFIESAKATHGNQFSMCSKYSRARCFFLFRVCTSLSHR